MQSVKDLLFTPTGIILTLLHLAFFVGAITCVVGFRIYVLHDVPALPKVTQSDRR